MSILAFFQGCGRLALAVVTLLALAACATPLYPVDPHLPAPRTEAEWTRLVDKVRDYQQRIGFQPTANFRRVDETLDGYVLCAHGPRLYLPYSYQDPAIRWPEARTEDECRAGADTAEVSFGVTEALAGRATPLTARMLKAPFARFLYLVLHEDCHEQFDFPLGIEEALCNALAYAGMEEIARERFGDSPIEYRAISTFAQAGAARADFLLGLYGEVAALHEQHDNKLISPEELLRNRAELFRAAAPRLASPESAVNSVWLANAITYSRHYRVMQRVIDAFDGDLARTVAFFRRLDAAKTDPRAFAAKHRYASTGDVAFLRAYEAAVVAAIEQALQSGELTDRP